MEIYVMNEEKIMDSEVDVIGVGGAGGFLASSLYQGGLRPRIISRGAALQQLREIGLTIIIDNKRFIYVPISCSTLDDVQQFAPLLVLEADLVEVLLAPARAAPRFDAALRLVVRQGVRRHLVGVVNAAHDDRVVRVALQEIDDHLLADARDVDPAPGLAGPHCPDAHPA